MKITTKYKGGLLERIEAASNVTWLAGYRPTECGLPPKVERITLSDEVSGPHLYYSCLPMPDTGYTVVDNDEFIRRCAEIAPREETSGWECKMTTGLMEQIEAQSDVRWNSGDAPTKYACSGYVQLWRDDEILTRSRCSEGSFEIVTPEEFVAKCAELKPKKLTLEDVCRPVIQWMADNSDSYTAVVITDKTAAILDEKTKRVTL